MELPAPLLAWSEWLAWFSPDLAPEVGELVRRLHPLIGRFRGNRSAGEPQPDGLGDLHRRGPYERLITTEWLLAEEVPDEFLRRAAAGEHLFLAPRPRAQQAEKLIVALFDAGPLQLGGPRLAQLALWILLARRAREAGGELRWGILQASPALYEANNPDHLRKLLTARTYTSATSAHLASWQNRLADNATPAGEIWLIGSDLPASTQQHRNCTHRVTAKPTLAGGALDVVIAQGTTVRRACLPLPESGTAIRLLKGLFLPGASTQASQHWPSPHRLSITLPPLLSWQGRHVAVAMLEGRGAMVFQIPRLDSEQLPKPRRQQWPAAQHPLAMAFSGKTLMVLLGSSSHLTFWQLSQLPPCPRPSREVFEAPPGRANLLPAIWLRSPTARRLYAMDTAGRLVYWQAGVPDGSSDKAAGTTHHLDDGVLHLAQVADDCLVYVRRNQEQLLVHRVSSVGKEPWGCPLGSAPNNIRVMFGGGLLWRRGVGGCAIRLAAGPTETWRLHTPTHNSGQAFDVTDLTLASGWLGIGLVHEPENGRFGLLALGPQRNSLALYSGQSEALLTTAAPIAKFSVCPVSGLIAMLTIDRELIVYSVPERLVRLVVNSGIENAAD